MRDKYLLHIINELLSVVDPYFNSINEGKIRLIYY